MRFWKRDRSKQEESDWGDADVRHRHCRLRHERRFRCRKLEKTLPLVREGMPPAGGRRQLPRSETPKPLQLAKIAGAGESARVEGEGHLKRKGRRAGGRAVGREAGRLLWRASRDAIETEPRYEAGGNGFFRNSLPGCFQRSFVRHGKVFDEIAAFGSGQNKISKLRIASRGIPAIGLCSCCNGGVAKW